jgi:ribose 1,5-bisphosphokinase PhnN
VRLKAILLIPKHHPYTDAKHNFVIVLPIVDFPAKSEVLRQKLQERGSTAHK